MLSILEIQQEQVCRDHPQETNDENQVENRQLPAAGLEATHRQSDGFEDWGKVSTWDTIDMQPIPGCYPQTGPFFSNSGSPTVIGLAA